MNTMMMVELTVNRRWKPISNALLTMSEDQLRDKITWAVYTAVAESGEPIDDVSVVWRVRDTFPDEALQMEMTAGDWRPRNPQALWKAVQSAISETIRELELGGMWRVGGLVDMSHDW